MIPDAAEDGGTASPGTASPNVRWERSQLSRDQRVRSLGHAGATVWLTGLPASGKSTVAGGLERRLVEMGRIAYRLDGDNLRHGLNGDLGFDPADRAENVRRTAHVASLLADSGVIALVALVSPYKVDRESARSVHRAEDLQFIEVHVDTPLELCEERDPKGLYARARRGDLQGMTGVDDPYEPPEAPELRLPPGPLEGQVNRILTLLTERGILP